MNDRPIPLRQQRAVVDHAARQARRIHAQALTRAGGVADSPAVHAAAVRAAQLEAAAATFARLTQERRL